MNRLVRAVQTLTRWFAVASAMMTVIVMIMTCVDIGSRVITGRSVPGLLDLGEVALVVLVYAGIAQAQQARVHVAVELLTSRLPRVVAKVAVIIGLCVAAVVVAWAVFATGELALDSVQRQESRFGIAAIPIWPARLLIPLGLILLLAEILIDIRDVATNRTELAAGALPVPDAELRVDEPDGRTSS